MATEETLAWEARRRPRAALAAAAGPALVVGGYFLFAGTLRDAPGSPLLGALARTVEPGPVGATPSGRVGLLGYYVDHVGALAAGEILRGLGFLLIGLALAYLAVATRHRLDGLGKVVVYAPLAAGVLYLLASFLSPLATYSAANTILDGARTVDAVAGTTSTAAAAAEIVKLAATAALAAAFALVGLNAMRAGLLTRFMGILAMLCGFLTLIPVGSPVPLVQAFWLVALAVLIAGRWPSGQPPAWLTGRAEPWPTQQELREQREAAAEDRRPARAQRKPAAVAAGGGGEDRPAVQHPSSRKKKRKRRS